MYEPKATGAKTKPQSATEPKKEEEAATKEDALPPDFGLPNLPIGPQGGLRTNMTKGKQAIKREKSPTSVADNTPLRPNKGSLVLEEELIPANMIHGDGSPAGKRESMEPEGDSPPKIVDHPTAFVVSSSKSTVNVARIVEYRRQLAAQSKFLGIHPHATVLNAALAQEEHHNFQKLFGNGEEKSEDGHYQHHFSAQYEQLNPQAAMLNQAFSDALDQNNDEEGDDHAVI